jgi:hypothetical protein
MALLRSITALFRSLTRTIPFAQVERAYNRVRGELAEVGLLSDGRYLDAVECEQDLIPTFSNELGFVFDEGVRDLPRLVGYRPGVIYIPRNSPVRAHVPGDTLLDTMRHEFAHAWAALDPAFFRKRWFRDAFGAGYFDAWERAAFDRADFVSDYACAAPREDFAETFMLYLRARRSLARFRPRTGLHAKLRAVESAVSVAARERAHRRLRVRRA